MTQPETKISTGRLMLCIACFIQGAGLLTSFFVTLPGRDSWMIVVISTLLSLPLFFLFSKLIELFPGQNIIGMLRTAFGKIAGNAIGFLYVVFFLTLITLNSSELSAFMETTISPETPRVLIVAFFLFVCASNTRHGIEVNTRYALFFACIAGLLAIFSTALSLERMDFRHFLPMFESRPFHYVQATNILFSIPFGESVVFLMFAPHLESTEGVGKKMMFGSIIGGLTLLTFTMRDTAVLGEAMRIFALPSFETLRLVRIAEVISRLEILSAIAFLFLIFFRVSMLYYAFSSALSELFGIKSLKNTAYTAALIILPYALIAYPTAADRLAFSQQTMCILWLLFCLIIPLALLISALIKKRVQRSA